MAQLVASDTRGSNPVIGKIFSTFVYCQLYWKDENKEMVHLEIEFKRYQSEHTHSPKAKGRKEYGNKTFNANIWHL